MHAWLKHIGFLGTWFSNMSSRALLLAGRRSATNPSGLPCHHEQRDVCCVQISSIGSYHSRPAHPALLLGRPPHHQIWTPNLPPSFSVYARHFSCWDQPCPCTLCEASRADPSSTCNQTHGWLMASKVHGYQPAEHTYFVNTPRTWASSTYPAAFFSCAAVSFSTVAFAQGGCSLRGR